MNRHEFQDLAVERLSDADALLKAGRYACAYYIAGYAVECALKACIARKTNQDDFPPREAARYYVHDIPKLLDGAGLGSIFEQEARHDSLFRTNWAAVKDWTEETRYQKPRTNASGGDSDRDYRSTAWGAAMVKKKLVEELISDGAKLLLELDRRSFPVEAMFWIHLPDQDYWRLVIGSPMVREQGGLAGYGRLGEWLREIELAGITLEDISLLDSESREFQSLFSLANASSRLAAGAAWLEFEEAVVYRWTGAAVYGELTCDVSLSELNEIERKTRNLSRPALLISLAKRIITLRFHPQHGPLGGIEAVKFDVDFKNALRQTHPNCQINWL